MTRDFSSDIILCVEENRTSVADPMATAFRLTLTQAPETKFFLRFYTLCPPQKKTLVFICLIAI